MTRTNRDNSNRFINIFFFLIKFFCWFLGGCTASGSERSEDSGDHIDSEPTQRSPPSAAIQLDVFRQHPDDIEQRLVEAENAGPSPKRHFRLWSQVPIDRRGRIRAGRRRAGSGPRFLRWVRGLAPGAQPQQRESLHPAPLQRRRWPLSRFPSSRSQPAGQPGRRRQHHLHRRVPPAPSCVIFELFELLLLIFNLIFTFHLILLINRCCALFNTQRICRYRMKLGDENEWHHISSLCRNRVSKSIPTRSSIDIF